MSIPVLVECSFPRCKEKFFPREKFLRQDLCDKHAKKIEEAIGKYVVKGYDVPSIIRMVVLDELGIKSMEEVGELDTRRIMALSESDDN